MQVLTTAPPPLPHRVVLCEDVRPFLVPLHGREAHVTLALLAAALLGVRRALEYLPSSHPLAVIHATAAATPEALADFADFADVALAPADAPTISRPETEPPHPEIKSEIKTEPPHPLPGRRSSVHCDAPSKFGRFGAQHGAYSSGRFGLHTPPMVAAAGSVAEGGAAQRQLARAMLSAACERYPDEPRLAAALFEAAETPAALRKLAKTLLRRSSAALPTWLAYARAEERQGRSAEAFTVYASALSHCAPPAGTASPLDTALELLPMALAAARLCLDSATHAAQVERIQRPYERARAAGIEAAGAVAGACASAVFTPPGCSQDMYAASSAASRRCGEREGGAVVSTCMSAASRRALRWLVSAWDPAAAPSGPSAQSEAASAVTSAPSATQLLRARKGLEALIAAQLPCALPHVARDGELAPMTVQQHLQHLQHQPLDVQQQQPRDEPVDEPLDEARATLACALALFEYLTRGIEAALAVHARVLAALGTALGTAAPRAAAERRVERGTAAPRLAGRGTRAHERLIEHQLWLLSLQRARHAHGPSARERMVVHCALADFPANQHVLRTLLGTGAQAAAGERFERRRLLTLACNRHPSCPQLWLAFVHFELECARDGAGRGARDGAGSNARDGAHARDGAGHGSRTSAVPSAEVEREAASGRVEAMGAERRARRVLELAVRPFKLPSRPACKRSPRRRHPFPTGTTSKLPGMPGALARLPSTRGKRGRPHACRLTRALASAAAVPRRQAALDSSAVPPPCGHPPRRAAP